MRKNKISMNNARTMFHTVHTSFLARTKQDTLNRNKVYSRNIALMHVGNFDRA